jgi:phosphopantothenoylcysteine decarboxylase/phosphopantothenate--cysteine ligase
MKSQGSTRTLLVTAGPTIEDIDPVRFISNGATGRLGIEIVKAALKAGWRVILILGPVHREIIESVPRDRRVTTTFVRSAAQMHAAVMKQIKHVDAVIMNAGVADFAPVAVFSDKQKKADGGLILRLKSTPDILKELGVLKASRPELKLFGFALETGIGKTASKRKASRLAEARRKLKSKNLDLIVMDEPVAQGAQAADFTIIDANSEKTLPNCPKSRLAQVLVRKLGTLS